MNARRVSWMADGGRVYAWEYRTDNDGFVRQQCDADGWIFERPRSWFNGVECLVVYREEIHIATRFADSSGWEFRNQALVTNVDCFQPLPMVPEGLR